jgi:isopenicillin-N N-acyltransferase-like protein
MKLHQFTSVATDPGRRGHEIGTRFARQVRAAGAAYLDHFQALGIEGRLVREVIDSSTKALLAWAPELVAESEGIAEAAGLEPWQVGAIAARTEVLAAVPGKGECTTAVRVPAAGPPETIQTWDWHGALAQNGLLLSCVAHEGRRVKLFTEFGAAAKIGLNDAGLGLHFNILHHGCDDTGGGVPVHAIARRVLEEATTVGEAVAIATSAQVSASTVLTAVTYQEGHAEAASIEMSPAGFAVVRPGAGGWLLHTNHFLDPVLAQGEAGRPDSASVERYEHARAVSGAMVGASGEARAAAFCGPAGADAVVCVRPDESLPVSEQWGTLLTVSLDIPGFALDYRAASPDVAASTGMDHF